MKFAIELKRWRDKRTQNEAAKELGVSVKTYRNWEQGRNSPHWVNLESLLIALGKSKPKPNRPRKG